MLAQPLTTSSDDATIYHQGAYKQTLINITPLLLSQSYTLFLIVPVPKAFPQPHISKISSSIPKLEHPTSWTHHHHMKLLSPAQAQRINQTLPPRSMNPAMASLLKNGAAWKTSFDLCPKAGCDNTTQKPTTNSSSIPTPRHHAQYGRTPTTTSNTSRRSRPPSAKK